ncbi:hypothetical protein GCM10023166_31280 [Paeniglutamicibacter cryotolerans]|uniref:ABC-type transport system involved in multi-copper enzyme maturation permease subunit n=1 Tax=Paeniglutamicibacter cryotolerans TaxID=670079 RepID=A0A839QK71_9MICC|nr:ABC-type transport system involved in multi-copper enzyme maturation permease subunit [Paeniglutamicibacter cryotolerans]
MSNLRLWWQHQTDSLGLTDPAKRAPAMNGRVAAGLMTLFGVIGISQLVVVILEIVSGRN